MNKTNIFKTLNQPFILWFLSTILVGFISWQYSEIQKKSIEQTDNIRILKKAKLELKILLQDVSFFASTKEKINAGAINGMILRMQYNAINSSSPNYVSTLQNVMLEIDSRSGTKGIDKYQPRIFKHIKIISLMQVRIINQYTMLNDPLWSLLTQEEKASIDELSKLTDEILQYYNDNS